MLTAAAEIDLYLPLGLKIFGIKLYFVILLFTPCRHEQRITDVVIVKMERNLVVAVLVRRSGLPH